MSLRNGMSGEMTTGHIPCKRGSLFALPTVNTFFPEKAMPVCRGKKRKNSATRQKRRTTE